MVPPVSIVGHEYSHSHWTTFRGPNQVIVLSNNYGCAVTHSGEAKTLGIEMGAPWFKLPVNANRHW